VKSSSNDIWKTVMQMGFVQIRRKFVDINIGYPTFIAVGTDV